MELTPVAGKPASRIGLGTWAIGGLEWGAVPEPEAIATILGALDLGINFFDTAPIYGHGRAEELVGKAMRQCGQRNAFYIATKAGLNWQMDRPGVFSDSTASHLRQELEASLRRLNTDFIDLYQIHWPDPLIPIAETANLLANFQREGKVRALGVSNFSVAQMEEFRSVAPLASNQPPYNLFEREIDPEILPWCESNGVAILTYSSLCRSLLAGRLKPGMVFPKDDIRSHDPKFREPQFSQYLRAVDGLSALAHNHFGKSVLELAARWVLDRPGVSVALWGAKRPDQLNAIEGVLGWSLDASAMAEIDRIVAQCVVNPVGPEYLTPARRDRS